MESLRLAEPCARYAQQIEEYRLEFLQTGSSMDGTSSLRRFERAGDWLDWLTLAAKAQTCPLHWVPDQQYLCIRAQDDRLVGMADLRLAVNEKILLYYGQIGYSIRPGERGKGYGNRQLKLVLEAARARGMDRVLLTCKSGNRASARLIQKNGGALENTVTDPETGDVMERYWIAL